MAWLQVHTVSQIIVYPDISVHALSKWWFSDDFRISQTHIYVVGLLKTHDIVCMFGKSENRRHGDFTTVAWCNVSKLYDIF